MSTATRWSLLGSLVLGALLLGAYSWRSEPLEAGIETRRTGAERSSSPTGRHSSSTKGAGEAGEVDAIPSLEILVTSSAGEPIAGALVCAQPAAEAFFRAATSSCQNAGEDGIARWSTAPARSSRVTAAAAGFAAQERKVRGPETVTFALQPARSTVSGHIEDSSGGPVVGALLQVLADVEENTVVGASLSDSEGAFTVSTPPGSSQLRAVAHGYAAWQREVMAPGSGIRVVMALGSSISGHVTEAGSGRALSGVIVEAQRHDVQSGSFGRGTTSPEGDFTIPDLGPGMHLVRLVEEEWAADSQEVWLDLGTTANVELKAAQAGRVELTLTVGGRRCQQGGLFVHGPSSGTGAVDEAGLVRISGLEPGDYVARPYCKDALPAVSRPLSVRQGEVVRRTWDLEAGLTIQGQVAGCAASEAEGLTVRVFDPENNRTGECITDERGAFSCGGLVAGNYRCWVNLQDSELSNVVEVRLTKENGPGNALLTLLPSGSVGVTLKDEQGAPLGNVQLTLKAPGRVPLPAVAMGDGRSEFRRVPVGSYVLELEGAGVLDQARRVSVERSKMTEVAWTLPTHDVEGRVVDAAGAPQPDTWVSVWGVSSLRGTAPEAEAMTDAEGRFLLRHLARRGYAIQLQGPGGSITRSPVEVVSPLTLYFESETDTAGSRPARAAGGPASVGQAAGAAEEGTAATGEMGALAEAATGESATGFGPEDQ